MKTECVVTCPECGGKQNLQMPTDLHMAFYNCPQCQAFVSTPAGAHCIYCAYGDNKCPEEQAA